MALGFGRKKTADDAATPDVSVSDISIPDVSVSDVNAAPVAAHAPTAPVGSDNAFDFPTDAELEAPAMTTPADEDESVIDFDKLYVIEQQNAARNATSAAAPAPFVPPTATVQPSDTPFYEPQTAVEAADQPRKKLPLVPILGTVAILVLAGGAATFFANKDAGEDDQSVQTTTRARHPRFKIQLSRTQRARGFGSPPSSASRAPRTTIVPEATGIAMGTAPATTRPLPGMAGASPVSPGIAPVSAQAVQMKALWKRGADAKHNGDIAGARRYWAQGLKIEPKNLGFQQSLAKLRR